MLLKTAVRRYLVQLQADGRSPHTIDQAKRNLALLDSWLVGNRRSRDLRRITHETVAEFLASAAARLRRDGSPKRATSVNCTRSVMRTFFTYAHAAGFAPRNAGQLVRRARCSSGPPRALSAEEQQRLLDALATAEGPVEERDTMLFRLMLGTGIRLGSALALTLDDIDLRRREIRLRVAKNDRPDVVLMPRSLVPPLRRYCQGRSPGPLFPGRPGRPLCGRQARDRLRIWLGRANVSIQASCHSLRHTFATRLYERTRDVRLVQRALHHRSIAATAIYSSVREDELRRVVGLG